MPHGPTDQRRGPLDTLPRIVSVSTRLADYAVPKIFFVGTERKEVRRALEITVQTDAPIPARAISPVIWIGDAPVREMETVGPNQYRFYALDPAPLRDGAAIAFGWPEVEPGRAGAGGPNKIATSFRLRLGTSGGTAAR
jgi:hypothetical protein